MNEQRIMATLREINGRLCRIEKFLEEQELPVYEEEAAQKLGVSLRHLQNCSYKGLLEGAYHKDMLGRRVYLLPVLLGMREAIVSTMKKKYEPPKIETQSWKGRSKYPG